MQSNNIQSVHLSSFPEVEDIFHDNDLVQQMDIVREICNAGLSIRKSKNIRARIPLKEIVISSNKNHNIKLFESILIEEINVKKVVFKQEINHVAQEKITLNLKLCGKKLGKNLNHVVNLVNNGKAELRNDKLIVEDYIFESEEFNSKINLVNPDARICGNNSFVVELNTEINDELLHEGIGRDVARFIQLARKDLNLNIVNHINVLFYSESGDLIEILNRHQKEIEGQTLSTIKFVKDKNMICSKKCYNHCVDDYGEIFFSL